MSEPITGDRATAISDIGAQLTDTLTPKHAAEVLGDLGFLVVPLAPGRDSTAYLLVALRDRPSLAHYDPESVLLWTHEGVLDGPVVLDRSTCLPHAAPVSWGPLRITDRLGITNEYLGFGGQVRMERVDGMRIVVVSTPGPMLRRGGHSQGWDPGAAHLDGYFARLRARLGDDRDLATRVSGMPPLTRYAAYLASALAGFAESPSLGADRHADLGHLRAESERLRRDHAHDWAAGVRLLDELHEPTARAGEAPSLTAARLSPPV